MACFGTKAASARCVGPRLADLLGKGFLLYPLRTVQANARNVGGDSRAVAGRFSPEARLTRLLSCDFHLLNHLVTPVPLRAVFHLKRDSHDF